MLQLQLPDPLTIEDFLNQYWQRKPLLLRGALTDYQNPISAEELAGLACEEEVESRLIIEHGATPWELRHGPFSETDFSRLPHSHWTLLVQDMDKHLPGAAQLLEAFRFIPRWRVDDIMISYAADQGTVGPHTDAYDVFLVQTQGQRRWRISGREYGADDLLADIDLKVLKQFDTEQEWLLNPGDVLYLPPGVAHWGVAEGDCITCSVGFRAPSEQELLSDWCDHLIAGAAAERHYMDPPLNPTQASGEISPSVIARVREMLQHGLQQPETEQARWFGRYVTEPKPQLPVAPADEALSDDGLDHLIQEAGGLMLHPHSRLAYTEAGGRLYLFADGEDFDIPATLKFALQSLTDQPTFVLLDLDDWLKHPQGHRIVCALFNQGTLVAAYDDA